MLKSPWRPPKMQHSIHRLNYYNIKHNELAFISADLVRLRTRQRWMWTKCDFDNNFFFACSNVSIEDGADAWHLVQEFYQECWIRNSWHITFKSLDKVCFSSLKAMAKYKVFIRLFFFLRCLSAKFCFSSIFVVYLPSLSRWFFLSMSFFGLKQFRCLVSPDLMLYNFIVHTIHLLGLPQI